MKQQHKLIFGGIVAVVVVVVYASLIYPWPATPDAVGTIGGVKKYHAYQITDNDVNVNNEQNSTIAPASGTAVDNSVVERQAGLFRTAGLERQISFFQQAPAELQASLLKTAPIELALRYYRLASIDMQAQYYKTRSLIERGMYNDADILVRKLERTTDDFDKNKFGYKDKFLAIKKDLAKKVIPNNAAPPPKK